MIDKIKKFDLCLGCGLCESVLKENKCKMVLDSRGFYKPKLEYPLSKDEKDLIKKICPGIHVETMPNEGAWGSMKFIAEAWATDSVIRHKAASGGVVTSLAIFLLEHHWVDAILQVGVKETSYLYNELKVSRTREEIIANAQSRYAPALIFNRIIDILERSEESFAFIGKPCDIAAMQNFLKSFPQYCGRIKYYISIFCAGMPSYEASKIAFRKSGHKDEPISLKYRGDGWPGNFKAIFKDGSVFEMSYNESWSTILSGTRGFRCKICPDGIGMLADIAVGDSWSTKDGYPDFTEAEGKCFCMVRTNIGSDIMKEAEKSGYINVSSLDINKVKDQQRYQYERRKLTGWRLLPVQLVSGFLLKFRGLGIYRQACTAKIKLGLANSMGTFVRLMKL